MNKTIHSAAITLILFLFSCSSGIRRPESFNEKMHRYQTKIGQVNSIPLFPHISEQKVAFYQNIQKSKNENSSKRAPASYMPAQMKSAKVQNYSNKKLYFFTLLGQYQTISSLTNKKNTPAINSCPRFHTGFLDHQSKHFKASLHNTDIKWDRITGNNMAYFPELFLPVALDQPLPQVKDTLKAATNAKGFKSTISSAFDKHLAKTFSELKELCHHGSSYNYYAFENLLTHSKSNGLHPNEKNVVQLLKTSIYSNHLLISALSHTKSLSEYNGLMQEVSGRIGGTWINNYFNNYKKERAHIISSSK